MTALVDIKLGTYSRPTIPSLQDLFSKFTPPLTLQDQFQFLSETPNSHYDNYVLAKRTLASKRFPSICHHLLYNPNNSETSNAFAPTSFRQRCIYFLHLSYIKLPQYVFRCIKHRISETPLGQSAPLSTPINQRRRIKAHQELDLSPGLTAVSPEGVINQYKKTCGFQMSKSR